MVVKKYSFISSILLLCLIVPQAIASNDLVQMDLKRSSDSSVDVTLFTTDSYGDNVLVRKKSDNKYVILVPNVQSSGFNASNLNGVKDLVSNVDIKTINDTNGGYTKVTLITTKPLDIKTKTVKNGPITAEQKEYNTLIAQANAVKNSISTKQEPPKIRDQKTEITVNKAPNTPKAETVKSTEKKVESTKVNDKTQTSSKEIKNQVVDNEKIQKEERKEYLNELINEAKEEQIAQDNVLEDIQDTIAPEIIEQDDTNSKISIFNKIKNKLPRKRTVGIFIIGLIALSIFKNIIKAINSKEDYSTAISQNNEDILLETSTEDIEDNTSWEERYNQYIDKSAQPVQRAENKGEYTFIKTPAKTLRKKRQRLEGFISNSNIEPEIVELQDEGSRIYSAIKLKAFENSQKVLNMTDRKSSRFKKYEIERPLKEAANVELGSSLLHSNPRRFENAALKVEDVDTDRLKYVPKEYIMSSIDEYLSILDNEAKIEKEVKREERILASNPITKTNKEPKLPNNNSLIVKSGYNIDSNKGIFLVNHDGKNALVGKVNDEIFILKKFDKNVTSPIQVRQDNANVYMVRAGGFKSMVEVKDNKMGVLIEL